MATTTNGIYYPNDYDSVADIPEDMKKIAESVDTKVSENKTEIENIKKEQTTQNANISSLEKDNTTNKQDITNIKAKDTDQDKYIAELEAENARLREDLNGLPKGQASGESIDLSDSAEMRCDLKISGNSKQETRSGKNKFIPLPEGKNSGLTIIRNKDGTYNISGTSINRVEHIAFIDLDKSQIKNGVTYVLSSNKSLPENMKVRVEMYNGTATWVRSFAPNIYINNPVSTGIANTENVTKVRFLMLVESGTTIDIQNIGFQLEEGTIATEYEQYGASPSPDYPSDNESCGDNINLFDKENANILNAYIDGTTKQFVSTENARTLYISCKPNKTYTIKKVTSARFGVGTCSDIPANRLTCTNAKVPNTGTEISIDSGSKDKYLCVFYYLSTADTLTEKEILNSIKIVEGTETGEYSPYGQGCINEVICNKNIFNKNDVVEDYFVSSSIVSNSSWCYNLSQCFKTGKKYTTSGGRCILSYFNGDTNISYQDITNGIITIPENTTKVYISTLKTNLNILQIEEGSTATPYIEHQKQVSTIPTQQPFRAIGDTRDTFIKKNNKWYERHWIPRYIFTGNEEWKFEIVNGTNSRFTCEKMPNLGYTVKTNVLSLCNAYSRKKEEDYYTYNNAFILRYVNDVNRIDIIDNRFDNIDDFKSFLQERYNVGTPLYVDYVLETPLDIECTEEQSTILWDIEQNAKTYDKVTHMYSTDNVSSYKDVTYKKDLETLITNIEQAILSQGGNI